MIKKHEKMNSFYEFDKSKTVEQEVLKKEAKLREKQLQKTLKQRKKFSAQLGEKTIDKSHVSVYSQGLKELIEELDELNLDVLKNKSTGKVGDLLKLNIQGKFAEKAKDIDQRKRLNHLQSDLGVVDSDINGLFPP